MPYDYFKKITRLYFQEKEGQEIRPISEIDADIITQIIILTDRSGNRELTSILKMWKRDSDFAVLDLLKKLESKQIRQPSSEEQEAKDCFVKIADTFECSVRHVLSFEKGMHYSSRKKDVVFTITLNPTPPDVSKCPLYANKEFQFNSQEHRDEEWKSLKQRLATYAQIHFV